MVRSGLTTDPATSARMKGIRQRHTKPELLLRKLLWATGLRYRCNVQDLPGSPDLVNQRQGWAIFVHGCFWHGHAGCKRATIPKRNASFWVEKIAANQRRDQAKAEALRMLGLEVVTVWECEVSRMGQSGIDAAPESLLTLLRRLPHRRSSPAG